MSVRTTANAAENITILLSNARLDSIDWTHLLILYVHTRVNAKEKSPNESIVHFYRAERRFKGSLMCLRDKLTCSYSPQKKKQPKLPPTETGQTSGGQFSEPSETGALIPFSPTKGPYEQTGWAMCYGAGFPMRTGAFQP